jgi:hypothetical protein
VQAVSARRAGGNGAPTNRYVRTRAVLRAHPLAVLLAVAALLRLVAAIFARGYMASDDHHQVVELAARWLRGEPVVPAGGGVFYRSLLYPGLHWAILGAARRLGLTDPDAGMLLVRLVLGAYSLWGVAITWKYGRALGDRLARGLGATPSADAGTTVGLLSGALVAAHALMPYVSVRSLVEMAALPPLLHGLYLLDRAVLGAAGAERRSVDNARPAGWGPARTALLSGALLGLAVVFRTQVVFAVAGAGAWLVWQRRVRLGALWLAGCLAVVALQGAWDFELYGRPFASTLAYLGHNRMHVHEYVTGPWYRTLLLVPAAFLPPFGILFVAAMFRLARRSGPLFWATAVFVVAHAVVPQKQERFLLPIFPELALLGTGGLVCWARGAGRGWVGARRAGWIYFWSVNLLLLPFGLFHYGQRARIEPFLAIHRRGDARELVVDMTEEAPGLPLYYLDGGDSAKRIPVFRIRTEAEMDAVRDSPSDRSAPGRTYVIVFSSGRLPEHLDRLRRGLGPVRIVDHFPPGPVDRALRALNPRYNKCKESWLGVL